MNSSKEVIKALNLKPHPEGGYFRETYRSVGEIDADSLDLSYAGKRNYSTCIYFLLTSDNFSAFHRIKQDEIWHFYEGSPITLHIISKRGIHSQHNIGRDFSKGQVPQLIVPGGNWFTAKLADKNSYALVGCTVSPGFDFKDFELISRKDMTSLFPEHKEIIEKLTHH